tara:strand:- start:200 stop:2320 length:2121 start_codon:yes stop_codon:yes gene_type:complete
MKLIQKITFIIILLFFNFKAFAEVSSFVDDLDVPQNSDKGQNSPSGITFNPDGTRMFIAGFSSNRVIQFTLSTPFDISEATFLTNSFCNVGSEATDGTTIEFNSDGTKFFLADMTSDDVEIYSLTTAYDVSTCVSQGNKSFTLDSSPNLRAITFSNDGKNIFLLDKAGGGHIFQYSLSSPFDLSNETLVKNFSPSGGLNANGGDVRGIAFSSDGSKMFITSGEGDTINEYSLSIPFNLTGNVTHDGFYNTSDELRQVWGVAFNTDGSKMFVMDYATDETSDVHEYNLSCGFGVVKCIDPTANKDDVASIESQSEASKKLIQHTTYPVLNRMEWLRRNSGRINLTNQNIKFQFKNEMLNTLSDSLIPLYFSNDNSNELTSGNLGWSFWSEGTISIGTSGDTSSSSSKDISSSAITLGADKKGADNIMRGIALRFGSDDVDVGDLGSALDMNSFSLTFYESRPKGEDRFIDHLMGLSFINSDLINNSGSASTNGERYGEQLFGSLSLRDTLTNDKFNFTPKLKINYGLTHYGAYTEAGAEGINLKFQEQYVGNFITSLGSSIDNTFDLNMGTIIPFFDFEYYADMSPSSKQKFSYNSDGTSYVLEDINSSTHNLNSSIGFDFISNNGLTLMTKYTRDQAKHNKNDNFIIAFDYKNSRRSLYSMSIQDNSAKLSHDRELNNLNINIDSHYDLFKKDPDYGLFVKISNIN